MKNKIVLFLTGCLTLLLPSCLGSDSEYELDLVPDSQISSFRLSHDSIPVLSSTKFIIDQINGRIFNHDSLPYGTKVEEVVATIEYSTTIGVSSIKVMQSAVNDSLTIWNGTDSLNFSDKVLMVVTAFNGINTKEYTAQVNIHQVVPDSMVWNNIASLTSAEERKVIPVVDGGNEYFYMYLANGGAYKLERALVSNPTAWTSVDVNGLPSGQLILSQIVDYEGTLYAPAKTGELYRSTNGADWSAVSNAPSIVSILGIVKEETVARRPSALAAIINKNGSLHFASLNKDGEWIEGNVIHNGFPISGFGAISHNSMFREHLLLVGGRNAENTLVNTAWATMDGRSWAVIKESSSTSFEASEGLSVVEYDDALFLVGGVDSSGKAYKDIYLSKDRGITWTKTSSLVLMPDEFKARAFASAIVDKNTNNLFLFGGKERNSGNDLGDLWVGRINRLGFEK